MRVQTESRVEFLHGAFDLSNATRVCSELGTKVRDILVGEVTWLTLRLTMVASLFWLAMAVFGVARTPVSLLVIPAAALNGLDSLLSMVQMPGGVPVGTLSIGKAGAVHAEIMREACRFEARIEVGIAPSHLLVDRPLRIG